MRKIEENKIFTFKCKPVKQLYYNEDSCYGIYVFYTEDDIPEYNDEVKNEILEGVDKIKKSILVGNMQYLYLGTEYEITAEMEYNDKYKQYQYKAKTVTPLVPKTKEQQRSFLKTILTEKQADTLIEVYPNIVEEIKNGTDNVDLSLLHGIGSFTYERIKYKIVNNYVMYDILTLLQPLGVTYAMTKKLMMGYSNAAVLKEKLLDNPYILLSVNGLGWKRVDELALKLKPEIKVSMTRTKAFVSSHLSKIGNDGHTVITNESLENAVRDNIIECMDLFYMFIENEMENEYVLHFDNSKNIVGLKRYYDSEIGTYEILKSLSTFKPLEITEDNIDNGIAKAESEQGFKITDEQRKVVLNSLDDNVCFIVGFAGTGKSTISRAILNIYADANYSIACCAFSAKAAQRIIEATGFRASTIHKLLGSNPNGKFDYDRFNPLDKDVILVDEGSMINAYIFYQLVSAIKEGSKVIICGDSGQLPPIGYGNIFRDITRMTETFNILKLTKVLRQAEKSGILTDANLIREGIMPIKSPELKIVNGDLEDMTYIFRNEKSSLSEIAIKSFLKAVNEDGLDEVAIVTPRRDGCDNSSFVINNRITDILFDKKTNHVSYGKKNFFIGSKVMHTENDNEKNVLNGEIGYVTDIYENERKKVFLDVTYKMGNETKVVTYEKKELDNLDLAYAMTCHKMQGSGCKSVIILLDMTHFTLLDTCMLYTSITRAKKRCLLLAEPRAFKKCIDNNNSESRETWLKHIF